MPVHGSLGGAARPGVEQAGEVAAGPPLSLPSAGPDPVPWDTALAAVLGYARGRRALWFRSPGSPEGRWVRVPAFGYERFDCRPRVAGALGGDDVRGAEGLHTVLGDAIESSWSLHLAAGGRVVPVVERSAWRPPTG